MHNTTIYLLKLGGKGFSFEWHFVELPTLAELSIVVTEKIANTETSVEAIEDELDRDHARDDIHQLRLCAELLGYLKEMPAVGEKNTARAYIKAVGVDLGWIAITPIAALTRNINWQELQERCA